MQNITERVLRDAEDKMLRMFRNEIAEIEAYPPTLFDETLKLLARAYIQGRAEGEAFVLSHMNPKKGNA